MNKNAPYPDALLWFSLLGYASLWFTCYPIKILSKGFQLNISYHPPFSFLYKKKTSLSYVNWDDEGGSRKGIPLSSMSISCLLLASFGTIPRNQEKYKTSNIRAYMLSVEVFFALSSVGGRVVEKGRIKKNKMLQKN